MKCPICDASIYTRYDAYGQAPSFSCPNIISLEPNGTIVSHYEKYETGWEGISAYEEHAIALPYKVINNYHNYGTRKPYCIIMKYEIQKTNWGLRGAFNEIFRLDMILEISNYKKMQNKIKTLIIMS